MDHVGVNVLVSVETKVLNKRGDLNVSDEILGAAEVVLGACHGEDRVEWLL